MSETPNLPAVRTERPAPMMAGGKPMAIVAHSMEDAYRLAVAVVKSGLAPKGMETPEACMVAVMFGAELGLTPMASIQRLAIINGRPVIGGEAALGLIEMRGLAEYVKEWFEGEGNTLTAHCETKRKNGRLVKQKFSVADAIQAGLWDTRDKVERSFKNRQTGQWEKKTVRNDAPWFRFRARMLQMRARGFALRDCYPDVLMGLYLTEEIEPEESEMRDITPANEEAPDPGKEESDGTAAAGGDAGGDRSVESKDPPPKSQASPISAAEAALPAKADAAVAETGEEALTPLTNPEDTAAGWITAFAQAETAQDLRDFEAAERIFDHIDAKHFLTERAAARIEDAYNKAMSQLAGDEAEQTDAAPNPDAQD